ncbi:MAG TPA: DUF559 domain-containing protein, partial [Steroidobacteraceae bacterium]|nr:DUF559 domain-containing protein [Steroidobacteraceae bacterium]
ARERGMKGLTILARELRDRSTEAERLFWSRVRAHRLKGHKFKRQQVINRYIVDFVCFEAKLVVELDGGQHANSEVDRTRDIWLNAEGYRVLRFWNNDVLSNIEAVMEAVMKSLTPSPHPSPVQGEGADKDAKR